MEDTWTFVVDIAFFALVGLLTFPLVILMVGQWCRVPFNDAYGKVKDFFGKWAQIQSAEFFDKVFKISGVTAALFLLGFAPYVANRIGDVALPKTAYAFGYFGYKQVGWSIRCEDQWDDLRWQFRTLKKLGDRSSWEKEKAQMGRYDVRFFRTVAVFLFFLALSALIALARTPQPTNSPVTFVVAAIGFIAANWLWAEREQQYTENLIASYVAEYRKAYGSNGPDKPPAYDADWWWPPKTMQPALPKAPTPSVETPSSSSTPAPSTPHEAPPPSK